MTNPSVPQHPKNGQTNGHDDKGINFTRLILRSDITERFGISPSDKYILIAIADRCNGNPGKENFRIGWPSMDTLVSDTGVSKSTIRRSIRALIAEGLIKRHDPGTLNPATGKVNKSCIYALNSKLIEYIEGYHHDTPIENEGITMTPGGYHHDTGGVSSWNPNGYHHDTRSKKLKEEVEVQNEDVKRSSSFENGKDDQHLSLTDQQKLIDKAQGLVQVRLGGQILALRPEQVTSAMEILQ